jgi:hypothetical protein
MNVTQNLGEEDTKFIAKVNVSNNGSFDAMTWVCIDLIQKPSVIPQVEGIINIPALTSEKIELGKSNMTSIKSNTTEYFSIPCYLRKTEKNKNEFYIQALVYVDIDGVDYQVDASTYYGIFNEQPICQGSWCVIIILGAIFGALIAVGIIAVIIRILYPLYRIKKVKLKEERKRIDNKINR